MTDLGYWTGKGLEWLKKPKTCYHRKNSWHTWCNLLHPFYLHFTTEIENGTWHCSIDSRGSQFYHNSSLLATSINVGGSGKASDNTRDQLCIGVRGHFFFSPWLWVLGAKEASVNPNTQKSYRDYPQNTLHVELLNRPTLSIAMERLACLNKSCGVQLGTLA